MRIAHKVVHSIFAFIFFVLQGCIADTSTGDSPSSTIQWSTPVEISATPVLRPASNAKGEFLVASAYNGSVSVDIYRPNQGWLGMHLAGTNISSAGLAINDSGQGVYAFQDASNNINVIQYSPDTGWTAPQTIGVGQTDGFYPSVVIDQAGTIIVLWRVSDSGGVTNLYAARYEPISGWAPPKMLSNMSSGGVSQVKGVAVNDSGYAMVLWVESANNIVTLKKVIYSPTTGWGTAITAMDDVGSFRMSKMDRNGYVALITHTTTTNRNFVARIGLNAPVETKQIDIGMFGMPLSVSSNSAGDALFTWGYFDGVNWVGIRGITYSSMSGWGSEGFISQGSIQGIFYFPTGASGIDNNGNMFLMLIEANSSQSDIKVMRSTPENGWGAPEIIASGLPALFTSNLTVSPQGSAMVLWLETASKQANFVSFYPAK